MVQYQVFCYILLNTAVLPSLSAITSGPPPIFEKTTQLYSHIGDILKRIEFTPVIVGNNGLYTTDIVNEFIRNTSPLPVIIFNDEEVKAISKLIERPKFIFVFVDFVDIIEDRLQNSDTYTFLNVRAFMFFTVCFPVNDILWVERILKLIWKNNILNFILVYYHESLELVSYNPFEEEIINLTNTNGSDAKKDIFINRLHNMNGYQLRVGFFADPPRIVEINKEFYGMDYMILKGFIRRLNATMKLIVPSENTVNERYYKQYTDILSENSDFGFVGCFTIVEAPTDVTTSYPRKMDDLVVLVPCASAVPQFYYIFMVFGKAVWLLTIGSFFLTLLYNVLVLRCLLNECENYLELLLEAYNMLKFGTSNHGFASLKLLPLFWIFICAILDSLFCSLLTSGLITPKFGQNMETLDELKANNVTITIHEFGAKAVKGQYPLNLIKLATVDEIMEKLIRQNTDSAYAVQMSIAELITAKVFKEDGRSVYHIMKEHLVPGYLVYLFPINSPYVDEANKYLTVLFLLRI